MKEVYILGGLRSHIGLKNGIYKNILPEILGSEVLKALINKYNLTNVDEIICGNAVGTGGNITRLMALNAGISEEVPAFTIDMQCASSSASIDIAFSKISSGQSDLIIAGGFESSSTQPIRAYNKNDLRYNEENPNFTVAQFSPGEIGEDVMLQGAERIIQNENISKEELDFWTLESHKRAKKAKDEGSLNDIIFSVNKSFCDEGIREKINQRLLDRMKPLLNEGGKLTAGNTCLINDGAAFVVLCSEEFLLRSRMKPKAKIIKTTLCGGNPLISPASTIKATDKLLESVNLKYTDISAFEFNEAFGVIDVIFQRKNQHLINRYNILGGALAYGHPYGASGAIIMLHLLKSLEKVDGKYGVSAIAAAGGVASAILIEMV
ncbi:MULTISPECIES: thiolase family protein [unclassified Clostridium]|uniref:thiolase family protein n=1 Tax=unclassified Clostridium TaxID=2614128 RepID=UPI000297DB37|nr:MULTISPECIES: thiolase family protein [unclassified Clostridium]EKQ56916.1 MAG: acetyl-CoA acetyltransferase [Clostridium sp. Maddingley MBC34-26]